VTVEGNLVVQGQVGANITNPKTKPTFFQGITFPQQGKVKYFGDEHTITSDLVRKMWKNLVVGLAGHERNEAAWLLWDNVPESVLGNLSLKIYGMNDSGNVKKIDAETKNIDASKQHGSVYKYMRSLVIVPPNRLFMVDGGDKVHELKTSDLSIKASSHSIGTALGGIEFLPDRSLVVVEKDEIKAYKVDLPLQNVLSTSVSINDTPRGLNVYKNAVFIGGDGRLVKLDMEMNIDAQTESSLNGKITDYIVAQNEDVYVFTGDGYQRRSLDLTLSDNMSAVAPTIKSSFVNANGEFINRWPQFNSTGIGDFNNPVLQSRIQNLYEEVSVAPGHSKWGGRQAWTGVDRSIIPLTIRSLNESESIEFTDFTDVTGAIVYDLE